MQPILAGLGSPRLGRVGLHVCGLKPRTDVALGGLPLSHGSLYMGGHLTRARPSPTGIIISLTAQADGRVSICLPNQYMRCRM